MNYKAILAKLLGLGPDAEDEAIQAALDAMDADKAKKDDEAKAAQEVLSARVEALEKGREEDAKQRVILSARMEGKQVALSADALAKLSVEDVEKHVAALPVTVPLSALTPGIVKEPAKPSAIDEGIMRNLGLTEEDFK